MLTVYPWPGVFTSRVTIATITANTGGSGA